MPKKNSLDTIYEQPQASGYKSRVLFYIFSAIIITLLALLLLTVVITKQVGEPIMVLNHGMMLVSSENMGATIPKKSVIILKKPDIDRLSVDDIITVKDTDENGASISVTTRIIRSNPTTDGLTFITKGDLSDIEDIRLRTQSDIYGQVIAVLPEFGQFLSFVKSPMGLAVCVAFPLALLLLIEIINLFRMSKHTQTEEQFEPEKFGTRNNINNDMEDHKKVRKSKRNSSDIPMDYPTKKEKSRTALSDIPMDYPTKKEKSRTTLSDIPLSADQVKQNLSQKVKALKHTSQFATPLYQPLQLPNFDLDNDLIEPQSDIGSPDNGIEPPDLDDEPIRIYTKHEDGESILDDLEYHEPRQFKIEPLNESRVRITPHKITTLADEEAETFSHKILTLRDELLQGAEIVENMGEFDFDHPSDLLFGINNADSALQNKHPFSRNRAKLALKRDEKSEFTAAVQSGGRDHFNIEGIDVKVKPNALRLNLDDEFNKRDVSITVTDEYTNVVVDGDEYQVNFALFKDAKDDEQKVVIQKKNKK